MNSTLPPTLSFAKKVLSRWLLGSIVICIAIGAVLMHFASPGETQAVAIADPASTESDEPIQPIVALTDLDPRKVALGRKLFHEPRLSHNNQIACANCHNLDTGGTDRKARSVGIDGAAGVINAPTVSIVV
jgi:cytochrome c peroxidase